jgi:hypothetical protein
MAIMKSSDLVTQAEERRPARLVVAQESLASLRKGVTFDSAEVDLSLAYRPWAKALNGANQYITVLPEEIAVAEDAYNEVAQILVEKLRWPTDSISILPQGSASTKTLIRSPFGEKFDIDAVCQVEISRTNAINPMEFFQAVGKALEKLEAKAKKRCWNIPFPKRPFYLEFTPSVPLSKIPQSLLETMAPRYRVNQEYRDTALAVVDTPTECWKTSNPAGMTKWVDDTAKRNLIRQFVMAVAALDSAKADVAPVPDQNVEITDTLRVAIRLFKRHRDMCVKRGVILADDKPISIIIVTLLTQCYEGFADLGRTYSHPVELLLELASLMPHLVLKLEGQYWVGNPTVEGENFAEKWNNDNGKRCRAFDAWCSKLIADMRMISESKELQEIAKRVREVFGIPAQTTDGSELTTTGYHAPPPVHPGRGLA